MAPNRHCEFILGLGYIVIEVPHAEWLCSDECETTCAGYEPKGIEAFAKCGSTNCASLSPIRKQRISPTMIKKSIP